MPAPYTPPAVPVFTPVGGMITRPNDGDPLVAASVTVAFDPLADRSQFAYLGLEGSRGSKLDIRCFDGDTILVNTQFALRSSLRVLSYTTATISISAVLGAPAASTWYYVYLADVAGVLTPVISTSPPDGSLRYRSGLPDQHLLTMFYSDSTGAVSPYVQTDNIYLYDTIGVDALILLNGVATTATAVPIPVVPPFARTVILQALLNNNGSTGPNVGRIARQGSGGAGFTLTTGDVITDIASMTAPVTCNGQAGVDYDVTAGGCDLNLWVLGFYL